MDAFNVRTFGAVGDGETKDTRSIQKAVDACGLGGGGIVLVPPGRYLSGTVYLRDNVCLELAPGAILVGSKDPADYNADDFCPQNRAFAGEKVSGAHLIAGVELKNVSIRGGGRIDGNGLAFFSVPGGGHGGFTIPGWRPGQMVFLCECENVRIEGVELFNSPYWTCFLHGCDNVFIRGVRIWNDRRTINGDGIDMDCCRQVVISDCIIESGDDCITLRGNTSPLKTPRPCEDVVVSNCLLKTRCNGIRIGVGDGMIRQAVFSNLIIGGKALNGICIQSNYCYEANLGEDHSKSGTEIRDIRFESIHMSDVCSALYISPGYAGGKSISDLHLGNIRAVAEKGSVMRGAPSNPLRHIVLSRVDIRTSGKQEHLLPAERWEDRLFEWDGCMPAALYLADCEDLEISRCRLDWGPTEGAWRHAIWGKRLADLRITDCRLLPPPGATIAQHLE